MTQQFSLPANNEEENEDLENTNNTPEDDFGTEPDEMDLSEDKEVVTIRLHRKGSNQPRLLEMRELSAFRREYYLNKLRPHFERDGKTIKDFKGIQTGLIGEVMFEDDKPVSIQEINEWPTKTIDALYLRATVMNGLDKDAEKRAKKQWSKVN